MRTTITTLLAAVVTTAILVVLDLDWAGGYLPAAVEPGVLGRAFLEMALVLPVLWAALVFVAGRPPALLVAAAVAVPSWWLGNVLAAGGGVERAGLAEVVRYVVPAASFVAVLVVARLGRGRSRWLVVGAACLAAVIVRTASRRCYVGLYADLKDYLFGVEALSLGFAAMVLLGATSRPRSWSHICGGLLAVVGTTCLLPSLLEHAPAPNDDLRARFGADGFHLARLQRWRGRRRGAERLTGHDEDVIARLRNWDERAREVGQRLDELLPARRRMNLLFITVDTLRPDRVGCIGGGDLTPAIDRLGASGTVFERAWAQYPSTHLSSASLFDGRYPTATHYWRDITADGANELESPSFIALARKNGMRTAAAVAFTELWLSSASFREGMKHFEFVNVDRPAAPEMSGEHFAASAMSALDRLKDDRFYLWFHLFDPHHPYDHHDGLTRGSSAADLYDGEVRYADIQVGRVLDHLDRLGLRDRTIVVFSSDHGEALGEHGAYYHASSLYEEQLRVPIIFRVPGAPPSRSRLAVENVDLHGTLQTLLGFDERIETQSTDLTPLIVEPGRHDAEFPGVVLAELPNDVKELSAGSSNLAAVVRDDWKLIRHLDAAWSELYDLSNDPGELRDRAAEEAERRRAMEATLATMLGANRTFRRREGADEIRRREIESLRQSLRSADPYQRVEVIVTAGKRQFTELGPDFVQVAQREAEEPEIRFQAFRTAVAWDVAGSRELVARFSRDPNPVFRWASNYFADGEPGLVASQRRELEFLWRRERRGDWVETARELLADRYLSHEIKRDVLDRLSLLPINVEVELAMMLLTGWDPSFDDEARRELLRRYSAAEIDAMATAMRHWTLVRDHVRQGRFDLAVPSCEAVLNSLPPQAGRVVQKVDLARALLGAGNAQRAQDLLDEVDTDLGRESAAGRGEYWRRAERAVAELTAWRPVRGPLDATEPIRVAAVQVELGAQRFVWPGRRVALKVSLSNESERALPGDEWVGGGRLRVLWSRTPDGEAAYGTEMALEEGLLPGERRDVDFVVDTPSEPGSWMGRVIINQHEGARFHHVEAPSSTFWILTWNPEQPLPPGRLTAPELFSVFEAEPGVEDWRLSAEGFWVMGVVTGFNTGLVSKPLRFDGTLTSLRVEGGIESTVPGGEVVQIEFLPQGDWPRHDPVTTTLPRDGSHVLSQPLALPKLEGVYRLRLVLGMRPGVFSVMNLFID